MTVVSPDLLITKNMYKWDDANYKKAHHYTVGACHHNSMIYYEINIGVYTQGRGVNKNYREEGC